MQIINPVPDAVLLTGNQVISGAKTFTSPMIANSTLTVNSTLSQGGASAEQLIGSPTSASGVLLANASNLVDATTGNLALTLPIAVTSADIRKVITKVDASANTVTISPQAGGTINGAANYVLTAQYQSVTLLNINRSVAGAWAVVGKT